MIKFPLSIAVFIVAVLLASCSFSESSKSSSTSSKSSSDSASSPSSSVPTSKDNKKSGYENDIRDYTAEFVKSSGGNAATFRAKLSGIAAKYGVSQWDQDKSTYLAIGRGLRKAGLRNPQYDSFKTSLGDGSPWKMQAIDEGYK